MPPHMVQAREQTSPFLSMLPPEIRNRIYRHALSGETVNIVEEWQPGLTRACRQLRDESLLMHYSLSSFVYRTTSSGPDALASLLEWLRHIGPQRCKVLGRLVVHIGVVNGLMLGDPRSDDDPWSDFVEQAASLGVSQALDLSVQPCRKTPSGRYQRTRAPAAVIKQKLEFGFRNIQRLMTGYLQDLMAKQLGTPLSWFYTYAAERGKDMMLFRRCTVRVIDVDARHDWRRANARLHGLMSVVEEHYAFQLEVKKVYEREAAGEGE